MHPPDLVNEFYVLHLHGGIELDLGYIQTAEILLLVLMCLCFGGDF